MLNKLNWEQTKQRWNAYWNRSLTGLPLMCIVAEKPNAVDPERSAFLKARDMYDKYRDAARIAERYRYWAETHAAQLGVRDDQIMVGGESAGGGLTAALCMYEKDIGGIHIASQMPLYPMLDNEDTESSRNNHAPVWNTRRNHYGWARYLRGIREEPVPAYAAPARCTDYTGLPPAYSFVSTAEPFYAETLTYIENLKQADVAASVDVYPSLFHAFDMLLPFLKVSRRAAAAFEAHFERAMHSCFAEQTHRDSGIE